MELKFKIENQVITRTDKNVVVAGSKAYLTASFEFSDDWENAVKHAVFFNEDLNLIYRYQWNSSDKFGFIKKATLINNSQNQEIVSGHTESKTL